MHTEALPRRVRDAATPTLPDTTCGMTGKANTFRFVTFESRPKTASGCDLWPSSSVLSPNLLGRASHTYTKQILELYYFTGKCGRNYCSFHLEISEVTQDPRLRGGSQQCQPFLCRCKEKTTEFCKDLAFGSLLHFNLLVVMILRNSLRLPLAVNI